MPRDLFQRPLHDLRISVTDRCNFRCHYCMPAGNTYRFLPKKELLTFEEIAVIAGIGAELGVRKLRLTGGEPLLRRDLPVLVRMLSKVDGIGDLALTTNGFYLASQAMSLKEAGLDRVTVSLDSLDAAVFARLAGKEIDPGTVLSGIEAALAAGLSVKVNTVVQRGINDAEILPIVAYCRERGITPRFIEFMDVGTLNHWQRETVMTAAEILDRIRNDYPCEPLEPAYPGEVANRYRFLDGRGEIGLIASVSQPFCRGCTRARLSAEGRLFTCLFATGGHDLKTLLRSSGADAVRHALHGIWRQRADRYSELRGPESRNAGEKVEMYHIGG